MTDNVKLDFAKKKIDDHLPKDYYQDLSVDFTNVNKIIKAKRKELANKNIIIRLIQKIFVIVLLFYLIFTFVFGIRTVFNRDMFPKFVVSDLVIYYRLDREFHQGDVVAIHKDGKDYILRIVAKGNDVVDISDDNKLIVNDSFQAEDNIFYKTGKYEDTKVNVKYPLRLKEDEFFLLADMREGAKDSRYFGVVKNNEIMGKVFALYRRSDF